MHLFKVQDFDINLGVISIFEASNEPGRTLRGLCRSTTPQQGQKVSPEFSPSFVHLWGSWAEGNRPSAHTSPGETVPERAAHPRGVDLGYIKPDLQDLEMDIAHKCCTQGVNLSTAQIRITSYYCTP